MDPGKRLHDNREEILRIAAAHGAQNVRVFGSYPAVNPVRKAMSIFW